MTMARANWRAVWAARQPARAVAQVQVPVVGAGDGQFAWDYTNPIFGVPSF
jgi:hypothetical protein